MMERSGENSSDGIAVIVTRAKIATKELRRNYCYQRTHSRLSPIETVGPSGGAEAGIPNQLADENIDNDYKLSQNVPKAVMLNLFQHLHRS
ncbi:MAG: hypothetical protein ABIO46_14075 [Chitinophagales bacterium]